MAWADGDNVTSSALNFRSMAGPVANVRDPDYGATGDGSTSESVAIQAAISAVSAGGTVFIPAGIYQIETALTLADNVTLMGEGSSTTLRAAGNLRIIDDTTARTNVIIRDLAFDGNNSSNGSSGWIRLGNVSNSATRIDNVRCSNASIGISLNGTGLRVRDLVAENCGGTALSVSNCQDVLISGMRASHCSYSGVFIDSASTDVRVADSFFENTNLIQANGHACVNIRGTSGSQRNMVTGCSMNSFSNVGIRLAGSNQIVANNVVTPQAPAVGTGASGEGIACSATASVVANNRVEGTFVVGLLLFAGAEETVDRTLLMGNIVNNSSQDTANTHPGIQVRADGTNAVLTKCALIGNICFDDQGSKTQSGGIGFVEASGGDITEIAMHGNYVIDNLTNPYGFAPASLADEVYSLAENISIPSNVSTISDGDTTPSVQGVRVLQTTNTSTTTLTTLDDGYDGQEVTIVVDANTDLESNNSLVLASATDFSGTANDTITLVRSGGSWFEKARSVN